MLNSSKIKEIQRKSYDQGIQTELFRISGYHFSHLTTSGSDSNVFWPFPRFRWMRCRSCRRPRRSPCTSLGTASARWRGSTSTRRVNPACPDFWRSLVRLTLRPSSWPSLDFGPWWQLPLVTRVTPMTQVTQATRRFPCRVCFDGGRKLFCWKIIELEMLNQWHGADLIKRFWSKIYSTPKMWPVFPVKILG